MELLLVMNSLNTWDFTPVLFTLIFSFYEGNRLVACVQFPSTWKYWQSGRNHGRRSLRLLEAWRTDHIASSASSPSWWDWGGKFPLSVTWQMNVERKRQSVLEVTVKNVRNRGIASGKILNSSQGKFSAEGWILEGAVISILEHIKN